QILERVGGLPGVTAVSVTDCPPMNGGCNGTVIARRDRAPVAPGTEPNVGVHWIAQTWPTVVRVPLKAGRLFNDGDRKGAPKVVLINETAARRLFPGEDPIGRPVSVGQGGFWNDTAHVVGVIGNVRYESLDAPENNDVYLPYAQSPNGRLMLFVRTSGDPRSIVTPVRRIIRELSPESAVHDARTMEERIGDSTTSARFSTLLLSLFAIVALALAAIGTYGVISFNAAQRVREMGIRVALGATRRQVARLVVGEALGIAVAGGVIGVVAALAATRVLGALLYDVAPNDPPTFIAIVALLAGAVLLASWLPARRASRVAPQEALRSE
ncbi:MAG: FtsX-like permease family protein, partial [Gemmatimonadaceae bacterium]